MKKLITGLFIMTAVTAHAENPKFENLSKDQVEKVANEFAMNFAHTVVNAPETNGIWGVEVGVMAGRTASPELKKVVDASGGDGKDFKNIYHAGLLARAHFPLDIFVEGSLLPEREISDVKVDAMSLGLGWNAGAFFGLPLDLAIGASISNSNVEFKQRTTVLTTDDTETKINVDSKTRNLWVGVSKTFLFVTPYLKVGKISSDSDVGTSISGNVFANGSSEQNVGTDGSYLALGANLEFTIFKLGFEASKLAGVSRATAKFSLDF
jgi:hypothetical protein